MLSQNALLKATIEETPEGEPNIIRVSHNGETYTELDVKYVFDHYGPTGRYTKDGIIRPVQPNDFKKIINQNLEFNIQKNNNGELVLHFVEN